ncbi:hypothetical protein BB105_16675 [Salmonella enterica subsp. enterica serovar Panama]|nr:hypothetical protein [Salmonella enterica]EBS4386388.1 hypothetical protein [Salmonella enterica subsp. enterica serovar Panama]EDM6106238.1 hypothetical protein [Salmonella enterica subsp. enterica serovar Newport]EEJ2343134.1 hypothetical protein [Salmonella enterica subsp. enterica serovar Oslo]EAO7828705.1 hypothetical protein [Salmonella enterica]
MAKDIAFKLGAELNNEEAEIFADGYNAAMQSFGNSEQLNFPVAPDEIEPDDGNTFDYVDGWNACRAVMLQSKYRDLSQPVDPQISEYEKIMLRAGWVMVPVEPTDEMIVAAMDSDDVTYNESDDTVFYVHHCEIYKAMLAAAPQPEVK